MRQGSRCLGDFFMRYDGLLDTVTGSGRVAEGVSLLERVVAAQRDTLLRTGFSGQAAVLILLGEAYLLSGRTAEAHQAAQHGLSLTRERHERGTEAYGLQLLGEIASHGDPPDVPEAEAYYRKAEGGGGD